MNLIDTGIGKGLIRFDENRDFITFTHQNKKRNYNNPEEKVQTFLALVLIYGYPVDRITTGRSTNNNERIEIGKELARFIAHTN